MRRFCDFTADGAHAAPDRLALVADEGSLTFAELDFRAERLASAFREQGLEPGDRIAWLAANELEFVEVQSACLKGGFALVPLNWRLSVDELRYVVDNAEPAMFIHGRAESSRTRDVLAGRNLRLVVGLGSDGSYEDLVTGSEPAPDANPLDPELLVTLLFTSGTTGKPKGAMIDRLCLTSRLLTSAIEVRAKRSDVFLCTLPMFHIAAYMAYAYILRGATVVQSSKPFAAERVLQLLDENKVTAVLAVPAIIQQIVDHVEKLGSVADLSLEQVNYGGSSISPTLLKRAVRTLGCHFHQQYGLTETQMLGVLQVEDHDVEDPLALSSVGRPAITAEVRIVDPEGAPVEIGEIGEITSRGPSVMRGYWRNQEATERALVNGWMHTGDLGYIDKSGWLHLVDRVDDMIISGGENVYPTELESILMEVPGVTEVAVVGLPDEHWGQLVTAVIPRTAPDEEELEQHLRGRVGGYKVPRRWVRLDQLPRGSTGKVLRRVLKQQLSDGAMTLPES